MNIVSCDIGLDGGLTYSGKSIMMPTVKVIDKPARYVLDLTNGKKTYIKSGPNKGEPRKKLKSAAKYHYELDCLAISDILYEADVFVIETPGTSFGNAASATSTTNRNYGKLLAIAELNDCEIVTVVPHKWKSDLKLTRDKLDSIVMAESLSRQSFRTPRGALLDGPAEAYLIGYWYINHYLPNQLSD